MSNVVNIRKGIGGTGHRFPFLDQDYNEAVRLLKMTSFYLEGKGRKDVVTCSLEERVLRTVATSHIVVQLTSVLGWLMALKAVIDGDITESQMTTDTYRINKVDKIYSDQIKLFSTMPDPIPALLKRKYRIIPEDHTYRRKSS